MRRLFFGAIVLPVLAAAILVSGAAAQVLHHHIAFRGELQENVAAFGFVQIQGQETFVRRLGHESQRQALLAE